MYTHICTVPVQLYIYIYISIYIYRERESSGDSVLVSLSDEPRKQQGSKIQWLNPESQRTPKTLARNTPSDETQVVQALRPQGAAADGEEVASCSPVLGLTKIL